VGTLGVGARNVGAAVEMAREAGMPMNDCGALLASELIVILLVALVGLVEGLGSGKAGLKCNASSFGEFGTETSRGGIGPKVSF
jgi:hypothetical protein